MNFNEFCWFFNESIISHWICHESSTTQPNSQIMIPSLNRARFLQGFLEFLSIEKHDRLWQTSKFGEFDSQSMSESSEYRLCICHIRPPQVDSLSPTRQTLQVLIGTKLGPEPSVPWFSPNIVSTLKSSYVRWSLYQSAYYVFVKYGLWQIDT